MTTAPYEIRIQSATGETVILRVAPGAGRHAAAEIARMTMKRLHGLDVMDGALLMNLLTQKEPIRMKPKPPLRDPNRPITESSVWPWYIKRAVLIAVITAASLTVWCNQSAIRTWYEGQMAPAKPKIKTHQQREREQLDRDRPTRTPLRNSNTGSSR